MKSFPVIRTLCLVFLLGYTLPAWSTDTVIGDTSLSSHEIMFCSGGTTPYTGCAASDLRVQADALANPVAIFEYVRNNYDYSLYHGARSGAINTYLGGRGNDVDLAATLIAMLRSQGTPARYVVGTVHLSAANVMNWLAVENPDLAYGLLRDQGIQNAVLATDKSTIDFEHVWVEALIPYGNYRGAGPTTINCNTTPALCDWVPLDPSFKQRGQRVSGLDPYSTQTFNYTAYYSALANNDLTRRDKNPLEIYQEQVLAWLQTSAPGKTLEDIPDFTGIVSESDGLLPDSLPFATVSSLRRYNSAADHDVAFPSIEPKKWMKYVTAAAQFGASINLGTATVSLVDAATQRFTFTFNQTGSNMSELFRLGGTQVGGAIILTGGSLIINGQTIVLGSPFSLVVTMDGAPAPDATTTDQTITANYNAIVGGYYLIATGGETSNWSQVHRASQQLLAANQQYKIVFNPADPGANGQACDPVSGLNCTPYVDINGTGVWAATDPRLLDDSAALDAMTGGLLYVAGYQYYASMRDGMSQLDAINKVKTPITGFLGVVSSTYDVEYIDGTAFAVLPGGLLIDMKGVRIAGSWRINQPSTYSNTQFELIGHMASSLEHETWQQLTGYDAISTVRGIQLALSNGATLVNPVKNSSTDTVVTMYPSFGYGTTVPSSFTRNMWSIFGQSYLSYGYTGTGASSFYAMRPDVTGLLATDPLTSIWAYSSTNGYDSLLSGYNSNYNALLTNQTVAATPLSNIALGATSANFPTADIISASLTSSPGFALSAPSFVRVGAANSSTYNFYVNETSALADGSYSITVNSILSNKDGGYIYNGNTSPYIPSSIQIVSPAGFQVGSPSFSGTTSTWSFDLLRTTAADGTYTVVIYVYVNGGYFSYSLTGVQVLGGRIVLGSIGFGYTYTIHNNTSLTCNGTTYTNLTATVLLGDLQGCLNSAVAANASYFNFFTPSTSLVFRALPATNNAQLTTQIGCIRKILDQQNLASVWGEYVIPSQLSVGSYYRFGVAIQKTHDAVTGNINGETYGITNDQTFSLNDSTLSSTCP